MAPSLPVVAITCPRALNRPTGQVGADSGLNHPVRSLLESLRGRRSWELGGRLPGALKGPPQNPPEHCPLPSQAVVGTGRHRFIWGCLPSSSASGVQTLPLSSGPLPRARAGALRRRPPAHPIPLRHLVWDTLQMTMPSRHSAPALGILPEASQASTTTMSQDHRRPVSHRFTTSGFP